MNTTTFVLDGSSGNAWDAADFINSQAAAPRAVVTVNGVLARARFGAAPASGWGTGSLSVRTPARTTRGNNEVWFKTGATVTVLVDFDPAV